MELEIYDASRHIFLYKSRLTIIYGILSESNEDLPKNIKMAGLKEINKAKSREQINARYIFWVKNFPIFFKK